MTKPYSLGSSYKIYPIRGLLGYFHLLHDLSSGQAVLIDTGLAGEMPLLERTLRVASLSWHDIKAILLTHGHLDHTGHVFEIRQRTGAPVLAHAAEQPHINGTFVYRGASRVCGALEAFGRLVLRYRPVEIDEPLQEGMELPFWGGLRVIHLPGHTHGHCGFYSARFGLLFSGDLFASYGFFTHLPPAILNSCPEYFRSSLQRVMQLSPKLIIPNHYFGFDGALHSRRFAALAARLMRT
jgi:glyoxylase-like metal-dependent hydrolase (beta-lactamase superfamily II)